MKDTRLELLDISLYDYQYLQDHLTDMAAKGWHLEKLVGMYFWKYRRGEPKHVRYEVTYSSTASAFNSRPTEAEEALADICAEAGWVRVAALAQMQVFRNEDPNATPLETDDRQRLANIRRTMKRHLIPQHLLLILLFVLQFCMHCSTLLRYPSRTLSDPLMVSTLGMLLVVSILFTVLLIDNLRWVRKAQRAVDEGQSIPGNGFYRRFRYVIWAGLVLYLSSLFVMVGLTYVGVILGISAITLTCTCVSISLCKRLNAPKWVNILVPVCVTSLLMMFLLTLFAINMDRIVQNEELPHPEEVPLMLSDLTDPEDTECTVFDENTSPLASYSQYSDEWADERISYTIVDIKCPLFYDLILNEQEKQFMESASWLSNGVITLNQRDLWGAEYVRRAPGDANDRWLICWEDRVVSLRASWLLTDEQIAAAAEILKP